MLKSLYISSFVIIDKLNIEFFDGMSVLTGETGAGKSIIIDALGQLCGNRASSSLIKKNASKAIIEGIFEVNETDEFKRVCDELHIELDDQLVITKEILDSGKSNVKINYQNASNNALKMITPYLVDIHSQFETQKLFIEKNHIHLLDEYASKELKKVKDDYKMSFEKYKDLSLKLKNAIEEDLSDEQLDYLNSQLDEIDQYAYNDDEINEFENELKILQDYEKVNDNIQSFSQLMNSSHGILPQLKESLHYLQNIVDYGDFNDSYEKLYDYYYNFIDEYDNIMNIYHSFHFDEYRFNELQDILYNINRLKRKYGYTMERIKEYREELIEKIDTINNREEYINNLENQVKIEKENCLRIAEKMHKIRIKYAQKFEKNILKELKDLYLEKAIFKVSFESTELTTQGTDKIKFMVALNQGQELSLLNESASGGEISRIMLAIKTIILSYNQIDTIVFDEVDTGVSGKVATSIGQKMRELASQKQVLCISHLPQVASLAHHHYSIEKQTDKIETASTMRLLSQEERVYEIAKMLSNKEITQEAINNAKQLLNV